MGRDEFFILEAVASTKRTGCVSLTPYITLKTLCQSTSNRNVMTHCSHATYHHYICHMQPQQLMVMVPYAIFTDGAQKAH